MAGAGYKLFNTGDVLTAAQVNTYLQEQTVMVFASSAARTSALSGVLAEGMVSYLQDTNAVEVYNGSAWVGVSGAGDLTEIVAGTGITVTSGTGPIPTVALTTPVAATNGGTAQTTYTTGDLLYASGTNTLAKRAIGSTGNVLTVSGGVPTWAAPAGGGKVLQVVSAKYSTQTTVASSSFTDTGLTLSITPSAASSKVLVLITQQAVLERLSANEGGAIELRRDSTTVYALGDASVSYGYSIQATGATIVQRASAITISYLDAPNTTSSVTYKTRGCVSNTSNSGQVRFQDNGCDSTITLLEIGA